ncbi:MAG: hypothetical protein ACT4NP_14170 [Pseudonocardiales bacterium]
MSAAHCESHSALLQRVAPGLPRPVDAIVVAAGRPTRHVAPAVELAARLGCHLVAVCSGQVRSEEFAALASEWPGLRWHAVHLPDGYDHPLLAFASSRLAELEDGRHGPLNTKRNIGLLLARMLGWRTVLFLDDDIFDVPDGLVRRAAAGLGRLAASALAVADWPDNSVVCHANRLGEPRQDVFVSGSALLVDTTQQFSFFPKIYNEDWLFLFDWMAAGLVGRVRSVRQLRYDPFEDPGRAAAEEVGEVIAEGMIDLLHRRVPLVQLTDPDYWQAFLLRRKAFIARAADRIAAQNQQPVHAAALVALAAAERRRSQVTPAWCGSYLQTWRIDAQAWVERIGDLSTVDQFSSATDYLDLSGDLVGLNP